MDEDIEFQDCPVCDGTGWYYRCDRDGNAIEEEVDCKRCGGSGQVY